MAGTQVQLSVADGLAWITLDGPGQRNALDARAAHDLVAACDSVDADPGVGAAVVTGAGGAFCSGADTGVLDRIRGESPDAAYGSLDELYAGFRRFAELGVPTVAAVNGAAVAAGLAAAVTAPEDLHETVRSMVGHLAADPPLARALKADLRRTVYDVAGWDRAVEIERVRQMWSLTRPATDA